MHLRLLPVVFIVLCLAACQCTGKHSTLQIETKTGSVRFKVEVVRTQAARTHGLMEREKMSKDAGMIFVFDETSEHPFWMKDTLIPLDVIFFDEAWKVVGTIENLEPMSRATRTIGRASRYALEVNAGVVAKEGIATGDVGSFTEVRNEK